MIFSLVWTHAYNVIYTSVVATLGTQSLFTAKFQLLLYLNLLISHSEFQINPIFILGFFQFILDLLILYGTIRIRNDLFLLSEVLFEMLVVIEHANFYAFILLRFLLLSLVAWLLQLWILLTLGDLRCIRNFFNFFNWTITILKLFRIADFTWGNVPGLDAYSLWFFHCFLQFIYNIFNMVHFVSIFFLSTFFSLFLLVHFFIVFFFTWCATIFLILMICFKVLKIIELALLIKLLFILDDHLLRLQHFRLVVLAQ